MWTLLVQPLKHLEFFKVFFTFYSLNFATICYFYKQNTKYIWFIGGP